MSDMAIHQLESCTLNQGSKKRLKRILFSAGFLCACIYAFKFYWLEHICSHRTNVHLVDLRAAFLGHGIYGRQFWNTHYRVDDPAYWYWDNFKDPNNRGYDALRRLFRNEISKVVPPRLVNPIP
ncbi:MAG: hypothetical protein O2856_11825 [Planctomycetota bacterium]|nr:hypothetical protein [Planctomycetota bacterium]